jgi:hypothetical protein
VEKIKQAFSCVVQTIVVEGRDHIQPFCFVPGVLPVFPRGGEGNTVRTRTPQVRLSGSMLVAGVASLDVRSDGGPIASGLCRGFPYRPVTL